MLSPFFNFLLRACHNIVEGDVIDPRILLQITLGRPLSPGCFAEGSGWAGWDCYCRPLDQSVSWAFLTGTHSESLCRGVTVRCFVARPAHSVAARHPSIPKPPHVQYRSPLGGSALRGYQGSQDDNHIPPAVSPSSSSSSSPFTCTCVVWSHYPFVTFPDRATTRT